MAAVNEQRRGNDNDTGAAGAPTISASMAADLADLFKLMSDPTRLQIIAALTERELRVGELADALEMSMSAISHQLSLLRRGRLVRWRRRGREMHYTLDDEHVEILFRAGLDHIQHGRWASAER